jgi:hypothetical protein
MGTTTNMNDHIADINRLKELFEQNKSKSLTQAYTINHIDKNKVCFLEED